MVIPFYEEKDLLSLQQHNQDYEKAENISIDYAILEKSKNVATTQMKASWSDMGDFNALYNHEKKDKNNNITHGNIQLYDSKNSLIYGHKNLITCLGIDNIIAVETEDALLIADKNKAQNIKQIVNDLKAKNQKEVSLHNKGSRPWGYYETLSYGEGFRVKKILVKSKALLSLQLHNHRSEHWVVIKGTATVQKGEEVFELKAGESTFIPVKMKHRISNNTDTDLEIIEVQMGAYVEEDDIVRLEDHYGRTD